MATRPNILIILTIITPVPKNYARKKPELYLRISINDASDVPKKKATLHSKSKPCVMALLIVGEQTLFQFQFSVGRRKKGRN